MEAQEDHSIVGLVKSLRPNQQMSQTVVASHVILSFIRFARSVLKCGWFIKGVNDCLLWFVVILYDVCCRIFSYWASSALWALIVRSKGLYVEHLFLDLHLMALFSLRVLERGRLWKPVGPSLDGRMDGI